MLRLRGPPFRCTDVITPAVVTSKVCSRARTRNLTFANAQYHSSGTPITRRSAYVQNSCVALSLTEDPLQAKELAKYQLGLWGLEYFDLYLIHFPISLEDVDISAKYPPEWWGLDGGVHPCERIMHSTHKSYAEFSSS